MQFEDFDNKIRQAAEQHHPDYDEKAWAKMENLLHDHLPQKDDRRKRIIFFLLLFLIAGGGAWLVIGKPWQQNNQTISTVNTLHKNEAEPSAGSTEETAERSAVENSPEVKKEDKETIEGSVIENPVVRNNKKDIIARKDVGSDKQKRSQSLIVTNEMANTSLHKQGKILPGKDHKAEQLAVDITGAEKIKKDKNTLDNTIVTSPDKHNDKTPGNDNNKTLTDLPAGNDMSRDKITETKKDNVTGQPETTDKKEIAKKSDNKKRNSIFFSFSAGPDISSVGLDNPGKVKLSSGAGFGYTFKNKLTIRTGFYSGRKVYSATRYDYKPSVPPFNYNYIDKIDADCKVYEIPVSLAYNFSRSEKHSLFGAAGLSSYIMKKESYVYLYKYTNGQTYTYNKTINNKNKHYFSVLTLSGGYQRKINRIFSVAAEPYIKVPLAGVGFGKVKLNSAGVLVSVNISPFQQRGKK